MPTVALRQNADIPQQGRRLNTNVGATSAPDRDDADQCRRLGGGGGGGYTMEQEKLAVFGILAYRKHLLIIILEP